MSTSRSPAFEDALSNATAAGRPMILDGAMGTELDNRGADTSSPVWSGLAPLKNPELLLAIHADYVSAGAELITTSTFRTTKRAFQKAGLEENLWRTAAEEAVAIARRAAASSTVVAGSVAPLEDCFDPLSAPKGEEAYREHRLLIELLADAGVDILWLETFGTLGELQAAGRAARDAGASRGLPFSISVTTNAGGNLISGESMDEALALASTLGASAFLVNCVPVGHVQAALPTLKAHSAIPIGAYANLGVAEKKQDWSGSAQLSPEEYASTASGWMTDLIGACCGSTPDHIRALKNHFAPPLTQ